ncbi:hypothetical protein [Dictyobacter aurantiacus]|uniref:hypothetical protein n=1 Tax=Dictyobacter aurantiacus TaxID=1936993 RepID=UPI000F81F58D|nr:hypothetical protein [Dictyobacter aurantiacus]
MELDWSERSSHIRTLYRPWQSGDGYDEHIIQTAEAQLGCRLPTPLRTFYAAWGRRKDFTRSNQALVGPDHLIVRSDALIFCFENQAVCAWAIRREDLALTNPPVIVAYSHQNWDWGELDAPLNWMLSHTHVSDFLDTLAYHHALCGGAIHGGYVGHTKNTGNEEHQKAWLEQHWCSTSVGRMIFGVSDEVPDEFLPPLFIRDGQALNLWGFSVAVRDVEALDEISHALQVTWIKQW